MIITIPWLKEHLQTKAIDLKIIDQLTNIGLEVEGIKENLGELRDFKVAKILKTEKGQRGRRKNTIRVARQAMEKALQYAYRDRKTKKREFRSLWIQRINAGARAEGMTYAQLINGLNKSKIKLDRKILAELAYNNPEVFKTIVKKIQTSVN